MMVRIKDGKIVTDVTLIVPDGEYFMLFRPVNLEPITTVDDHRRYYFKILEDVAKETGNDKNQLHSLIKEDAKRDTTKDMDVADWQIFIQQAKWYLYQHLDLVI